MFSRNLSSVKMAMSAILLIFLFLEIADSTSQNLSGEHASEVMPFLDDRNDKMKLDAMSLSLKLISQISSTMLNNSLNNMSTAEIGKSLLVSKDYSSFRKYYHSNLSTSNLELQKKITLLDKAISVLDSTEEKRVKEEHNQITLQHEYENRSKMFKSLLTSLLPTEPILTDHVVEDEKTNQMIHSGVVTEGHSEEKISTSSKFSDLTKSETFSNIPHKESTMFPHVLSTKFNVFEKVKSTSKTTNKMENNLKQQNISKNMDSNPYLHSEKHMIGFSEITNKFESDDTYLEYENEFHVQTESDGSSSNEERLQDRFESKDEVYILQIMDTSISGNSPREITTVDNEDIDTQSSLSVYENSSEKVKLESPSKDSLDYILTVENTFKTIPIENENVYETYTSYYDKLTYYNFLKYKHGKIPTEVLNQTYSTRDTEKNFFVNGTKFVNNQLLNNTMFNHNMSSNLPSIYDDNIVKNFTSRNKSFLEIQKAVSDTLNDINTVRSTFGYINRNVASDRSIKRKFNIKKPIAKDPTLINSVLQKKMFVSNSETANDQIQLENITLLYTFSPADMSENDSPHTQITMNHKNVNTEFSNRDNSSDQKSILYVSKDIEETLTPDIPQVTFNVSTASLNFSHLESDFSEISSKSLILPTVSDTLDESSTDVSTIANIHRNVESARKLKSKFNLKKRIHNNSNLINQVLQQNMSVSNSEKTNGKMQLGNITLSYTVSAEDNTENDSQDAQKGMNLENAFTEVSASDHTTARKSFLYVSKDREEISESLTLKHDIPQDMLFDTINESNTSSNFSKFESDSSEVLSSSLTLPAVNTTFSVYLPVKSEQEIEMLALNETHAEDNNSKSSSSFNNFFTVSYLYEKSLNIMTNMSDNQNSETTASMVENEDILEEMFNITNNAGLTKHVNEMKTIFKNRTESFSLRNASHAMNKLPYGTQPTIRNSELYREGKYVSSNIADNINEPASDLNSTIRNALIAVKSNSNPLTSEILNNNNSHISSKFLNEVTVTTSMKGMKVIPDKSKYFSLITFTCTSPPYINTMSVRNSTGGAGYRENQSSLKDSNFEISTVNSNNGTVDAYIELSTEPVAKLMLECTTNNLIRMEAKEEAKYINLKKMNGIFQGSYKYPWTGINNFRLSGQKNKHSPVPFSPFNRKTVKHGYVYAPIIFKGNTFLFFFRNNNLRNEENVAPNDTDVSHKVNSRRILFVKSRSIENDTILSRRAKMRKVTDNFDLKHNKINTSSYEYKNFENLLNMLLSRFPYLHFVREDQKVNVSTKVFDEKNSAFKLSGNSQVESDQFNITEASRDESEYQSIKEKNPHPPYPVTIQESPEPETISPEEPIDSSVQRGEMYGFLTTGFTTDK